MRACDHGTGAGPFLNRRASYLMYREAARGVAPVRWTVNCFRERHCTAPEGDSEVAPLWSIVAPEVIVRSSLSVDRSKIMGDR